mmetsp:Transcript_25776/g.58815  ORF Transcript_25776/g.58815 Transcript_25776/m.58815 type:complete len:224 (-) Transcript_25776:499-1170(-)
MLSMVGLWKYYSLRTYVPIELTSRQLLRLRSNGILLVFGSINNLLGLLYYYCYYHSSPSSPDISCFCSTSNGTSLEYSDLTYSSTKSLLRLPNADMKLSQLGMTRSVSVRYTYVALFWLYIDSMSVLLGEGSCVVSSPSNSTILPRESTKSSAAENTCVSHILLPPVGDSPIWFVLARFKHHALPSCKLSFSWSPPSNSSFSRLTPPPTFCVSIALAPSLASR